MANFGILARQRSLMLPFLFVPASAATVGPVEPPRVAVETVKVRAA